MHPQTLITLVFWFASISHTENISRKVPEVRESAEPGKDDAWYLEFREFPAFEIHIKSDTCRVKYGMNLANFCHNPRIFGHFFS